MRPRLLDLFCGAGGCSVGYARAGFDVVGVDLHPQPNYPYEFIQADALTWLRDATLAWAPASDGVAMDGTTRPLGCYVIEDFDAIHASPPCQAHTAMRTMWNAREHPELVGPTRHLLIATGLPYVIENVPGAPLLNAVTICGGALGLGAAGHALRRHREFEANFPMLVPPCVHQGGVIGVYGDHARSRKRISKDRGVDFPDGDKIALASEAMGIDWMNWRELSQAIPPAYTELIGHQLLAHVTPPRDQLAANYGRTT